MYPVMLNVKDKKCVVVGGGKVALRKAKKLAECDAKVLVISPCFTDGFGEIRTEQRKYKKSDIEGAFLVTAATDNKELNRQITADARSMGILSYAADDAENSDFTLPAAARTGDITVTVSTNGKYPFLAKRIRDEISENTEFYNSLIPVLEKYRSIIISGDGADKSELLKAFVSDKMIQIAREDMSGYEAEIKRLLFK